MRNKWIMRYNPGMYLPEYWDTFWGAGDEFEANPPVNLILGKWLWAAAGPVKALGYENTHSITKPGKRSEGVDAVGGQLMTWGEFVNRLENVISVAVHYKDMGIDHVYAYAGLYAAYGHPEELTGFWAFWNSSIWKKLMGKTEENPFKWIGVDADGKPLPYYTGATFQPPHCAPWWRYQMCYNNPGWLKWLSLVAKFHAAMGYDLFFDNCYVNTNCYCSGCRSLGIVPGNKDNFNLRIAALCEALETIRQAGLSSRPGFRVAGNCSNSSQAIQLSSVLSGVMMEDNGRRLWSIEKDGPYLDRVNSDLIWLDYKPHESKDVLFKSRFQAKLKHYCPKNGYVLWKKPFVPIWGL